MAGHCAHCATNPRHPSQINCERHRRRRQPRWSSRYCDRWRCCGCPQQLSGWIPCEKTCPPPPIPRPLPGPSAAQASQVPPVWTPVAVVRRLEAVVRRALAAVRRPVTVVRWPAAVVVRPVTVVWWPAAMVVRWVTERIVASPPRPPPARYLAGACASRAVGRSAATGYVRVANAPADGAAPQPPPPCLLS